MVSRAVSSVASSGANQTAPTGNQPELKKKVWKNFNLLHILQSRSSPIQDDKMDERMKVVTANPEVDKKGILKTSKMTTQEIYRIEKKVVFSSENVIFDAICASEYDRRGSYVAKRLNADLVRMIKRELNEVKREMEVHEDSRGNTQFYK